MSLSFQKGQLVADVMNSSPTARPLLHTGVSCCTGCGPEDGAALALHVAVPSSSAGLGHLPTTVLCLLQNGPCPLQRQPLWEGSLSLGRGLGLALFL